MFNEMGIVHENALNLLYLFMSMGHLLDIMEDLVISLFAKSLLTGITRRQALKKHPLIWQDIFNINSIDNIETID